VVPPVRWILLPLVGVCVMQTASSVEDWKSPEVRLPDRFVHPQIACTSEELLRLREAWKGGGADHDVLAGMIADADKSIKDPLEFPPRGGQHNQWYQCEKCQRGLVTIDDTRHKCPGCGTVYSGEPYDDVVFGRIHDSNLHRMRAAAWAFAITSE